MLARYYINGVSLETAGVSGCSLDFSNMDVDKATLLISPDEYTDAVHSTLQPGTEAAISNAAGTVLLRGEVQQARRIAGGTHDLAVDILGPWYTLDRITFLQNRSDLLSGASFPIGMYELSGTISYCVTTVLNYAKTIVPTKIGSIVVDLPSIQIPKVTGTDQSCAQILRQILQWTRSSQIIFDYSTSPPTVYILKKGSTYFSAPLQKTSAQSLEYRLDDQSTPPNVRLDFIRPLRLTRRYRNIAGSDSLNANTYVGNQYYPTSPNVPKSLSATLELKGSKVVTHYKHKFTESFYTLQWYETSLYGHYPYIPNLWSYCAKGPLVYYPNTGYCKDYTLTVSTLAGVLSSIPHSQIYPLVNKPELGGWAQLPEEPLWDVSPLVMFEVSCDAGFATTSGGAVSKRSTFKFYCAYRSTPGRDVKGLTIEKTVDETTDTLEAIPAGLAQTIYGMFTQVHIGRLTHHLSTWAVLSRQVLLDGITSPVQKISISCATDLVTYIFGPPEHLAPQDALELFRSSAS